MAILTVDKSPIIELETGLTSNAVASDNPIRWDFSGADVSLNPNVYNVSEAVLSKSLDISGGTTFSTGITFNNDGSKIYIIEAQNNTVREYDLLINYDISTSLYLHDFSVSSQDTINTGIQFNGDGSKMYCVGSVNKNISEYNLSTNFNVSTASFSQSFNVSSQDTSPRDLLFNNDGSKMYIAGDFTDSVIQYDLTTNYDISTASFTHSFSVASEETIPAGICFNDDGSKMYVTGFDSDNINEYDLSTSYDISTSVLVQSISVLSEDTLTSGIVFNNDGSKVFTVGATNNNVREYTIGSIQTFTYDYVEFTIKQYTNTDATIQTVSTLRQVPNTDATLSLDISPIIKNYTDLILPTTNQETQDTYFARVEYQTYLNGVGQGVQVLPDIQVLQAAKQIGDEFGQNMGRYVIQDTAITGLYDLPITMEKPYICEGYNNYLSTNIKGVYLGVFSFEINTEGSYRLPLVSTGNYDLTVFWGDGSFDDINSYNQVETTHSYDSSGTYNIGIIGTIEGIQFNVYGEQNELSSISTWDILNLTTSNPAFTECSNLTSVDSSPLTVSTSNLSFIFKNCSSLNSPLSFSDTSSVTTFFESFRGCSILNQPLTIDTSSANTIENILRECLAFNQEINFDLTSCNNAQGAFVGCTSLNSTINLTNTNLLTDIRNIFNSCTSLTGGVNISDTSAVTGMDGAFLNCSAFDQDISYFDFTSVTNMTNFLFGVTLSTANYDLLLIRLDSFISDWTTSGTIPFNFHGGNSQYTTGGAAETARNNLLIFGLTITDGGPA